MTRFVRWIGLSLVLLLALMAFLLIAANTVAVKRSVENYVARFTDGEVRITGLDGRFPDALRIGRIELYDDTGVWLAVRSLRLDWSPSRLALRTFLVSQIDADQIILNRLPNTAVSSEDDRSELNLPFGIVVNSLTVDRFDLGEPVTGVAVTLNLEGSARIESLTRGEIDLSARQIDGGGRYIVKGQMDSAGLSARLTAHERPKGLLASIAGFTTDGRGLDLKATADGAFSNLRTNLTLNAGPVKAKADGTIDIENMTGNLCLDANIAEFAYRSDIYWQSLGLNARVRGSLDRPTADAALYVKGLSVVETEIESLDAKIQGDMGNLGLRAKLDGIEIPGSHPGLLRKAPMLINGNLRLDKKDRPISINIRHPLIAADGTGNLAENPEGKINLKFTNLEPFAALVGLDLDGSSELSLRVNSDDELYKLKLGGGLAVTGGMVPFPGLVGDLAKIDLAMTVRGEDVNLSHLTFHGRTVNFSARGQIPGQLADLDFNLELTDLQVLEPSFEGHLIANGKVQGRPNDLAVNADLKGNFGTKNWPRGPLAAMLRLRGLPSSPSGTVTAHGVLDRAPLELSAKIKSGGNDALRLEVKRAGWKSLHAAGKIRIPKSAGLPIGNFDLRFSRLADLEPLLGRDVTGSVSAEFNTDKQDLRLNIRASNAGFSDTASVDDLKLDLTVSNWKTHPVVLGRMDLEGISVGSTSGSASVIAVGPDHALALTLSSEFKNLAGSDAILNSAGVFDVPAQRVLVSKLDAEWKKQILKLLAPTRIDFKDGLGVERLRLSLGQQGRVDLSGRISPELDLQVSMREINADLVKIVEPNLTMDGMLDANVRLTGPPDHPQGTITVKARGLSPRIGTGQTMPPADLNVSAKLGNDRARMDVQLKTGLSALNIFGDAAFDPSGPWDLRARGNIDLALLEPVLAAQGRRLYGQINLNAHLSGSLNAPSLLGTFKLSNGEFLDFADGVHLNHVTAILRADGDTLVVDHFEGRAGSGLIRVAGTAGIFGDDLPINLRLTARDARPLSSDRLMVDLNAELSLRGKVLKRTFVTGEIQIIGAEIMIPERTPASIAVLDVRRPGEKPPPPSNSGPKIALDLNIDAPEAIFVRGRGVDAELAGKIHLLGTLAGLRPLGKFTMRRGSFSLAGQTLVFSKGEVGFYGGSLTDPSLLFTAETSSSDVTAILTVKGTANKPKITLSSKPSLPQDEVLAHLLFGRGTSNLSPFEWVQIAAAVGTLTGVTSGGDSFETVRKGLGLDRLSFGSDNSGSPTLEAGRYVGPGVYVGTKQGVTGGSQATVQIDVARGLKLESSIGTGTPSGSSGSNTGTSSVGVIYEFEY